MGLLGLNFVDQFTFGLAMGLIVMLILMAQRSIH